MFRHILPRALMALAACTLAAAPPPDTLPRLKAAFQNPPDDARVMMRWWWFGPSVTTQELEREMRLMKEGGIGGFEVQPTYPLALDDPATGFHNYPYLSDEFLKALRFTAEKARELGLRMDLTLGSGWPFGGPHIPITQAAGRLRVVRAPASAPPRLAEGERLIGSSQPAAPGGEALYFIAGRTRMMVKRPAAGAEGFVLDHYDRSAVENHLTNVGEKLLGALRGVTPHAIFSDSLEVYSNDWTGDLLEQFLKRRGYDLKPYLDLLTGNDGEKAAAVRHDWGKTLTELAEERYLTTITQWARQHGTLFRSQTYGIPPVTLSSAAIADLPEGEGSEWRRFSTSRWASSASHLAGKPVTSSETWTWLHSPVFRATPLDMKAEADLHFLQGINQLIGHGWPYSPPEAGEPGWRFYAAGVFNSHNPWWIVMPDITRYLQRVSFLLRQGKPANDIALYLPVSDAYARFTAGGRASVNEAMEGLIGAGVVPAILDAGYNFDFIDDGMMARVGVPHRILIIPGVERMPLATCRRIEEYARTGGIVIALRRTPSLAPGLQDAADTPAIERFSRTLFQEKGARGRLIPETGKLADALHAALQPDLTAPAGIGFVHRKLPFADIYFLANTTNRPVRGEARFRVTGRNAAWWDPCTGTITGAPSRSLTLDLAPYESRVVVFSAERLPPSAAPATAAAPAIDLTSGWKVNFEGVAPLQMDALSSWADDGEHRFYSGLATYETTVRVPRTAVGGGRRLFLNFGEGTPVAPPERRSGSGMRAMLESPVREAAQVYVNGKLAGTVWRPPYEIDVTSLVRPGENAIRVLVGNLAINALAKGPLPDYRALNARYGERFQPQDMANLQPLPSGLLGPVRLIEK